jgi:phosphate starvation-inducible membrane PsiE
MLTHALQNLPVQFAIRFLIVVGITALLIIIDLHRTKKS